MIRFKVGNRVFKTLEAAWAYHVENPQFEVEVVRSTPCEE